MPGDAVLVFMVDYRPGCCIETGIAGQGGVMIIDGVFQRLVKNMLVQDAAVDYTEQIKDENL